jgi:hypothetical protein
MAFIKDYDIVTFYQMAKEITVLRFHLYQLLQRYQDWLRGVWCTGQERKAESKRKLFADLKQ